MGGTVCFVKFYGQISKTVKTKETRIRDTTIRRVNPQKRQSNENERACVGNKKRRSRASARYRREQGKYIHIYKAIY